MFNVVVKSEINQTLALSLSLCVYLFLFQAVEGEFFLSSIPRVNHYSPLCGAERCQTGRQARCVLIGQGKKNNNNRVSLLDEKRAHMDISSSLSQLFALIT